MSSAATLLNSAYTAAYTLLQSGCASVKRFTVFLRPAPLSAEAIANSEREEKVGAIYGQTLGPDSPNTAFKKAAREGDENTVRKFLNGPNPPSPSAVEEAKARAGFLKRSSFSFGSFTETARKGGASPNTVVELEHVRNTATNVHQMTQAHLAKVKAAQ